MIAVTLNGGLGNMMFQIAFIESFGTDVCYFNLQGNIKKNLSLGRNTYINCFPNIDWYKNQSRLSELKRNCAVPYFYSEVPYKEGTNYVGYFQSEKYFKPEIARKLFRPAEWVIERVLGYERELEGDTCSIHVRRGDYLNPSEGQYVQGLEYYIRGVDMLRADKYLVFSDDLDWCKVNLKGNFIFIDDSDIVSMFVMAYCKRHIVCNSSFSWWAAYLGGGLTIAPSRWMIDNRMAKDVIPDTWVQI
jgi:hypothetical protein